MKKIFPLKLSESVYADLKAVAKYENIPMSQVVQGYFVDPVRTKARKIKYRKKKKTEPMTLLEHAKKFAYDGPVFHKDKTDDELLYEGDL